MRNFHHVSVLALALVALVGCQTADRETPVVTLSTSKDNVTATGNLILTATATDNVGVSKVEFYDGTTKLGEDTTSADGFTHSLSLTAASNGTKSYTAKAFDAAGNSKVSAAKAVTVDIDGTAPTVSLTSNSTSVTSAGSITLTATASDNKGVTKVEFYDGTTKLGEDTTAVDGFTQSVTLSAANNGSKSYTAKAFDGAGNSTTSSPVAVTVNIDASAPTVSLQSSSTNVTSAGTITLTATASDNEGVVKVEFYDGTNKLGEDTTAADGYTQTVILTAANNGTKSYTAKAFDAQGNNAASTPVAVTVNIDGTPPTVALSSSSTNVTVAGGTITLTANASDNVAVSKVEFYDGTTKLGEDTTSADGFTQTIGFTAANNGTKSYTAKAFDSSGNTNVSSPVAVTVNIDNVAPTAVSLSSTSTNVIAAGSITLTATANDNVGVVKVEFFDGVNNIGTDTTPNDNFTQSVSFTIANNGTKSYTAKAFDAAGNNTTSAPVTVTVNIPPPAGSLDTTFGTNGRVISSVGPKNDYVFAMVAQPDGRMIVGGYSQYPAVTEDDFSLQRFNADGTPDTNFSGDGKVSVPIASGTGDEGGRTLALQSDGKIIQAGYTWGGSNFDIAVARYTDTGALDNNFDGDGIVITPFNGDDRANAAGVQTSDGKILIAGYTETGGNYNFALLRYNTNGTLDDTFDGDATMPGYPGNGKISTDFAGGSDRAHAMLIQPDGKIILGGFAWSGSSTGFALARYNTNGTLDTSFDGDGKVFTPFSGDDNIYALAFSGTNIVAVGYASNGLGNSKDFAIARYDSNGLLDNGFDGDGKATLAIGSHDDVAHGVAIQSDGKILVGGYMDLDPAGATLTDVNFDFALVRYNTNGSLDTGFGTGGKVTATLGLMHDFARGFGMIIQSSGKIVLAGHYDTDPSTVEADRSYDIVLTRYNP